MNLKMAHNYSRNMSLNQTMYEIDLNKIINGVVFDYILFMVIILYNRTGIYHLKIYVHHFRNLLQSGTSEVSRKCQRNIQPHYQ